jgi:hypothetical protein
LKIAYKNEIAFTKLILPNERSKIQGKISFNLVKGLISLVHSKEGNTIIQGEKRYCRSFTNIEFSIKVYMIIILTNRIPHESMCPRSGELPVV